jgi:CubicO group peptidase (beta-lactamase class C family)
MGQVRNKLLCTLMLVLCMCASLSWMDFNSVSAHPARCWQANKSSLINTSDMEPLINGLMADQMNVNHIPGAVVAVVKDGQLLFEKGYGYSDYESKLPVDPKVTMFRMGSVSKLFVWTAVMQLMEQGNIDLDADINRYLDFKIPATFSEPITMRHLLSHTAGFEDSGYAIHRLKVEQLISLEQYVKTRLPRRVYPPGKISAYSNYGASLAGYIVERISGMPFYEYVEKNIFTPLGMTNSTYRQPLPAEMVANMSKGYNYYQGQYLEAGFEYEVFYPAGGMTSTGEDMAKFMLAHLGESAYGKNRILQEQTAQLMHSQLFAADPRLPGMAYGFMENNLNGHRLLVHAGDTTFFASGLYLIPGQNMGIFIATNAPGGMIARNVLIKTIMDHYFPLTTQPFQPASSDFASRVAPYLGTYIPAQSNYTTPEKIMQTMQAGTISREANGSLSISFPGKTFHVTEVQPGLFRDRDDPNIDMVLKTDENGQAYMFFAGPNFTFIKVPWYKSITFINILIYLGLVLFLYGTTFWVFDAIKWLRKRPPASLSPTNTILARMAHWSGATFGLLLILAVVCMQIGLTSVDPNLGVPAYSFGAPRLFGLLRVLVIALILLCALIIAFTIVAWVRRLWSTRWRTYFSVLALSAISIVWVFGFWKLYIPLP